MPRASSRSSSSEQRELVARAGHERLGRCRVAADVGADQPQLHGERDEPLLRAVVQVALQPPPLGVAGGDDAAGATPAPRQPRLGLASALVLSAIAAARDRLDQLGVVVERGVVDQRGAARAERLTGRRPARPLAPSASA